ncbi:MAG: hypothetical protein NFCOHLIN_01305 [Gammaproteobacteria bacterium]|nr:hypothetical protein [Gammaproteobacteria bacterium]
MVAAILLRSALAEGPSAAPVTPMGEPAAEEQVLTGRELLDSCRRGEADAEAHTFCMTFMVGLVQTVSIMQQAGDGPALFCIDPNRVSPEDVRGRAVAWLQAHPERLDEAAYVLVGEALHQGYPCPPTGGVRRP